MVDAIFSIVVYIDHRAVLIKSENNIFTIKPNFKLYSKETLKRFIPNIIVTLDNNKFYCKLDESNTILKTNCSLFSKIHIGETIENFRVFEKRKKEITVKPNEEIFLYVEYINKAKVIYNKFIFSFKIFLGNKRI